MVRKYTLFDFSFMKFIETSFMAQHIVCFGNVSHTLERLYILQFLNGGVYKCQYDQVG